VRFVLRTTRRRSLLFWISDFEDPPATRDWRVLGRRHDLNVLVLRDPRDEVLPSVGWVEIEDLERGTRALVDTSSASVRQQYQREAAQRRRALEQSLSGARCSWLELRTERSYLPVLMRYFPREGAAGGGHERAGVLRRVHALAAPSASSPPGHPWPSRLRPPRRSTRPYRLGVAGRGMVRSASRCATAAGSPAETPERAVPPPIRRRSPGTGARWRAPARQGSSRARGVLRFADFDTVFVASLQAFATGNLASRTGVRRTTARAPAPAPSGREATGAGAHVADTAADLRAARPAGAPWWERAPWRTVAVAGAAARAGRVVRLGAAGRPRCPRSAIRPPRAAEPSCGA
jgi:hypothetical protein